MKIYGCPQKTHYINKKLDSLDDIQYIITVNEDEIIFPESEGVGYVACKG